MKTAHTNRVSMSEEDIEVLQEVMNISFGNASADLAELIDIYVVLNVPQIKLISGQELPNYIRETIKDYTTTSVVAQNFWGKFKGKALLIFPAGSGSELIRVLDPESGEPAADDHLNTLEQETLIEIGNILIGACIGKLAELLSDYVTYTPPIVTLYASQENTLFKNIVESNSTVITMKTVFSFEGRDVNGYLFLIPDQESIEWLKSALNSFMEQYE